jgi:NAD(P)H-dependent FMN reductase
VPGVLKNALDWVVGSGELIDKPTALINTSARATHAYASLRETLTTMAARVVEEASMTIAPDGAAWSANGIAQDPRVSALLTSALAALARYARAARTP